MPWVAAFFFLFEAASGSAQWKVLSSFNSYIVSVHFLSREGHPEIGFVGTGNGGVWRTTDYGKTWQRSLTPASLVNYVTSFSFKDQNTGWLSARQSSSTPGIYKTTDGGKNWSTNSLLGEQTCVLYNPSSRALITSSWSGNNSRSIDDGSSWTLIGISDAENGITFRSSNDGIISTYSGSFVRTTDGGITWSQLAFNEECWQPLGITGKKEYYVAAERNKQVLRSTDDGFTWTLVYQFPPSIEINGDIKGDSGTLYVQAKDKFYYSKDRGATWESYCGPGNAYDTRFFVSGDTVYAGTIDGTLWWNPYGLKKNDQLLYFPQRALSFSSKGCFRVDSFLKLVNLSNCTNIELTDIGINGSSTFSITKPAFPYPLDALDSLRIFYSPDDYKPDSAKLIIAYTVDGIPYEVQIDLKGIGLPGENVQLTKELDLLLSTDCTDIDTSVVIHNGPCDSLLILSLTSSDPTLFSITYPSSTPYTLKAGGSLNIRLHVNSANPGDYSATLLLRISSGGVTHDTSIILKLKILAAKEPQAQFSSSRIIFDSVSICDFRFDTLSFKNTICKPLKLTAISLASGDPSFSIVYQPALTRTLLTGESDFIVIRYAPLSNVKASDALKLSFEFDPLTKRDTLIPLSGIGKAISNASLASPILAFDDIRICDESELSTFLRNFSCDSISILQIFSPLDNSFIIVEPLLPAGIAAGDSIPIKILERPLSDGSKFDSIRIRIKSIHGAEQILTLKLLARVSPKVRLLSFSDVLTVDSLNPCSSFDTTIAIKNLGICDTLIIDSVTLAGFPWVSLIGGPLLPYRLAPGESTEFVLHFTPGASAIGTGSFHIYGNGLDTIIQVQATSKRIGAPFSLSVEDSIFYAYLCKTATRDFTIHNGGCDTLLVDSLLLAGNNPQFSFTGLQGLPLKIGPGKDSTITIEFDPSFNGDSTATLVVRSSSSGIIRSVPLIGMLAGGKSTAHFELLFEDGTTTARKAAGEFVTAKLYLRDNIPSPRDLESILVNFHFNDNVLTVTNSIGGSNWLPARFDSTGLLRYTLSRKKILPLSSGDEVAKVTFFVTIGDSSFSNITYDIHLNSPDTLYEPCVLEPLEMASLRLDVADSCGDGFIRGYMIHDPKIFDELIIIPNPTQGANTIETSFDLKAKADVSVTMFDALGKAVHTRTVNELSKGRRLISIPITNDPEGVYFIELEAQGTREMRKVVVVR